MLFEMLYMQCMLSQYASEHKHTVNNNVPCCNSWYDIIRTILVHCYFCVGESKNTRQNLPDDMHIKDMHTTAVKFKSVLLNILKLQYFHLHVFYILDSTATNMVVYVCKHFKHCDFDTINNSITFITMQLISKQPTGHHKVLYDACCDIGIII